MREKRCPVVFTRKKMNRVYKGDQPYAEFVFLCSQSMLFQEAIAEPVAVKRKLASLARQVVEELGRESSWVDLKETLKTRASGKVLYTSESIATALDGALRLRGQGPK